MEKLEKTILILSTFLAEKEADNMYLRNRIHEMENRAAETLGELHGLGNVTEEQEKIIAELKAKIHELENQIIEIRTEKDMEIASLVAKMPIEIKDSECHA